MSDLCFIVIGMLAVVAPLALAWWMLGGLRPLRPRRRHNRG